jgi:two-component system chemotaxis sensor kinase CheA
VDESREHIVALNRDLLELEERGRDASPDIVNSVFRAIHTIKGLSGMLGLATINELAHNMEDALSNVREGEVTVSDSLAEALFESLDLLNEMVEAAARGDLAERPIDTAVGNLAAAMQKATKAAGVVEDDRSASTSADNFAAHTARGLTVVRVRLSLKRDFKSRRKDMLAALECLDGAGEVLSIAPKGTERKLRGRAKVARLEAEVILATVLSEELLLKELGTGTVVVQELARPDAAPAVGGKADMPAAKSGGASRPEGMTQAIRVGVEKLDNILALVGELVIVRSRYSHVAGQALREVADALGASRSVTSLQSELNEVESSMGRTLNELQDAVMKARLVPLGSVFGKFRRAVRDIASHVGKQVRFESFGGETELDKKVIDKIGDPLMHLVRNAVDHGIELPDERARRGKPAEGVVRLSAHQEGDRVLIEVADNGGGLDRDTIVEKALELGMLTPESAVEATDADLQELISAPGFSTSREVTAVSGRGVGMDVVRSTLADLKGVLEVDSSLGTGTTFRIRLPLTMAIVDALLVSVGEESYAVAVSSVKEILEVDSESIHRVGTRECFDTDSRVVPLIRLSSALGETNGRLKTESAAKQTTVIVDVGDEEVGLAVDRVIGQQEIVIKALSRRFENVVEISGGSVLGDGSVCLILDVPSLVSKAKQEFADVLVEAGA